MSLLVHPHMNAGDVLNPSDVNSVVDSIAGAAHQITTQSLDYTVLLTDYLVLMDATAGSRICNLPKASTCGGKRLVIMKKDAVANNVTVTPFAGDSIQGVGTKTLAAQYDKVVLVSDGVLTWISEGANII